jgi:hypothetical protein
LTEEEKNHVTSVMMQYVKQSSIFWRSIAQLVADD